MTLEKLKELLTVELFASIIEINNLVTKPFRITNLEIISDIGFGENFMSKILKVNVTVELLDGFEIQNILMVVKHVNSSGIVDNDMMDEMKVFEKEVEMYRNVLPTMEQIWCDRAGVNIKFGPKLYFVTLKPEKLLVLEDLKMDNYSMMNRLDGLNECQIYMVLEKLAQWHAASRIYYDEDTPSPMYDTGMFKPCLYQFIEEHYNMYYQNFNDHLKGAGIDSTFLKSINTWKNKICSTNANIQKAHPNEFSVLNHGDLWINNLMFNDENVKMIDYQLGVYASPAVDLFYFLIMSVNSNLLVKQFDNFIAYYHKHLLQSLSALKSVSSRPTLKQLWIDVLKKSFYGCTIVMEGLPSIFIDHKNDGIDYTKSDLADEEGYEIRRQMFSSTRVAKSLEVLIPFLGKRGMLEI